MDFSLDPPDPPVYRGDGHPKLVRNLHSGVVLDPKVENSFFLRREIADPSEPLALRLCELRPDIHGFFFFRLILLTLVPLDLPFFFRRTITLAIENSSSVFAFDIICGALGRVDNDSFKLAPLVDMIQICAGQRRD